MEELPVPWLKDRKHITIWNDWLNKTERAHAIKMPEEIGSVLAENNRFNL